MIHDPDGDARFGRTPYKGEMPSVDVAPAGKADFKPMADDDKKAVAAFLASQADEPGEAIPAGALRGDAARVAKGKTIVSTRCTSCHLFEGKGDDIDQGLAPELSGWASTKWVRAQIDDPSSKSTYREKALDAGCDEYDTKPIDLRRLLSKMVRFVDDPDPASSGEKSLA